MATATNTSAVPSHPIKLRILLTIQLSTPPFGLDRLRREEQAERDEAHVINEVTGVEDPFSEVVPVVDDRQIRRQLVHRWPREAADPRDDPEHEEHRERHDAGDDLIAREARDEQPDGDEAAAEQEKTEIRRE